MRMACQIDEKVKEICRLEDELKERPTMEEVEETIRSASRLEEASVIFIFNLQSWHLILNMWFFLLDSVKYVVFSRVLLVEDTSILNS